MTVWLGELRLAAATDEAGFGLGLTARLGHQRRVECKNGRHGALPLGDGKLHGSAARLHSAHRVAKAERAGGNVCRPLAQRMPRGKRRVNALLGEHPPHGDADRQDCRLSVLGEAKVFFRALEDQLRERKAQRLVGLAKGVCGDG